MLHLPQKLGFFFNICWVLAALAAAIGMLRFNNKARKFSIIFCGINAFSVFIFFLIPVFRSGKPQKFLTFGFPIALALFYIFYLTRIGIKERFKKENE
jgi:amino acid transporter